MNKQHWISLGKTVGPTVAHCAVPALTRLAPLPVQPLLMIAGTVALGLMDRAIAE